MPSATRRTRTAARCGCLAMALLALACGKKAPEQAQGGDKQPITSKRGPATKPAKISREAKADFSHKLRKMTPAEMLALWDTVDATDLDLSDKRDQQCEIIERLTQAGAWDEALKLIARYGQGEHRQALVFSLFAKSPEPLDALLARMRGGEFSDSDRAILLRGLARNIAGPDGMSKVNALLAAKPKLVLSEAAAIAEGLAAGMDLSKMGVQFYEDPDLAGIKVSPEDLKANYAAAMAMMNGVMEAYPDLKGGMLNTFAMTAGEAMPFECWKTLLDRNNYNYMNAEERFQRLNELSSSMFEKNPQSAIAALDELRERQSILPMLQSGGAAWARVDIAAVDAWFTGEGKALAKPEADAMAHGVARFLAQDYRPAEGWKWVGRISDPEQKRKAEGQVWSEEKNMVDGETRQNPQQFVENIVAGKSEHADYWIESGMKEWIQRDADAAWKWYEGHSDSLTAKQAEAVSMAYARQALANGDVATARKWAEQVSTPKFKTKIDGEITAGAVGK